MDNILTDVSDDVLVTAIRANMGDFFRQLSRIHPVSALDDEKFTCWQAPVPHPWFNGILCSKPSVGEDQTFINKAIEYFRGRDVEVDRKSVV